MTTTIYTCLSWLRTLQCSAERGSIALGESLEIAQRQPPWTRGPVDFQSLVPIAIS